MANRSEDWFQQALRDLELARVSHRDNFHEWACFAAHQSAEKAVKALHLSLGQEAWGHVLTRLMADLPETVMLPAALVEQGRVLDNYYIPPRYPDSHPEGAPFEHYGSLQSYQAVQYAGEILDFIRSQMAGRSDG